MKYKYKISYGGTSSTTTSSNDLNAVNELNNLFEKLIKNKANYYDSSELKTDIDKLKEDELKLYDDPEEDSGDFLKEKYNLNYLTDIDFSINDDDELRDFYLEQKEDKEDKFEEFKEDFYEKKEEIIDYYNKNEVKKFNEEKDKFLNKYRTTYYDLKYYEENNLKKIYQEIIYDQIDYKIVTDEQLKKLIPEITKLYIKNKIQQGDYVIKEYLSEESKVIYLGDYHSSVHSLMVVIKYLITINILNDDYTLTDNNYIVFLGDIVDRGPYGIECLYIIYLLFYINNQNNNRIFVLNGNHEEKDVYIRHEFDNEMNKQLETSKETLEQIINYLPLALFLKKNNNQNAKWYQFCHGGIDYHQTNSNDIKTFLNNNDSLLSLNYNNIQKGFLWSDFIDFNYLNDKLIKNYNSYNDLKDPKIMMKDFSNRPVYNDYQVEKVLDDLNIMTIISGHQDLTNYAFLLKKYPLDKEYEDHGLRTFNYNFSDVITKTEQYETNEKDIINKESNMNNLTNYDFLLSKYPLDKKYKDHGLRTFNDNFSNVITKTEQYETNEKDIINKGSNMNNFLVKSHKIRMETILASVMSSATISRNLPYSVFGILDLKNDESEIIYLNPDFEL